MASELLTYSVSEIRTFSLTEAIHRKVGWNIPQSIAEPMLRSSGPMSVHKSAARVVRTLVDLIMPGPRGALTLLASAQPWFSGNKATINFGGEHIPGRNSS